MFETLVFQYLNKLPESKVRDFASPQAFHAAKVQCLGDDHIKPLAQVGCQLPMPISALIGNMPIETCQLKNTPPPVTRTFDFTTDIFIELSELSQGLFQELWRLYLLAIAQGQVSIFHAEVCPNALTCCRQSFHVSVVRYYAKPIVAAVITFDCNTPNASMPLTVFVKCVRYPIKLPFACFRIPFTKGYRDTIVFQRPTRRTRICDRFELMPLFDFRSTPKFIEKPFIRNMNPSQFFLNRLRWQRFPIWVCRPFQLRQMRGHGMIVRIRQAIFIALPLPLMKVFMHLPHIIKQVANADTIGLITEFIFIGFHGISGIRCLSPTMWEADTLLSNNALYVCQPDTLIIPHFTTKVKSIFDF